VVLMLLPHAAHALTITEGRVQLFLLFDRCAQFSGDDFLVNLCESGGAAQALSSQPFEHAFSFFRDTFERVEVGGVQICEPQELCGALTLRHSGLPPPPSGWDRTVPWTSTAPFTAVGFLGTGTNRVDIMGSGTVTGLNCLAAPPGVCHSAGGAATFQFAVSEPPSVWSTVVFGLALAGLAVVHRRQPSS